MSKLQTAPKPVSKFPDPECVPGNAPLQIEVDLSVESLLEAYRHGYYPKPEHQADVSWWCPDPRTVLFLDEFKTSRSLRKSVRNRGYFVTLNKNFNTVIDHCANRYPSRFCYFKVPHEFLQSNEFAWLQGLQNAGRVQLEFSDDTVRLEFKSRDDALQVLGPRPTWITENILQAYKQLHQHGHAHSVETWQFSDLVGGLYGVSIGNIFCGESMFSLNTDASKVALFHLVKHLKDADFIMIDCQEPTELLFSLGAREISRREYLAILSDSVGVETSTSQWEFLSTQQFARHPENHFFR